MEQLSLNFNGDISSVEGIFDGADIQPEYDNNCNEAQSLISTHRLDNASKSNTLHTSARLIHPGNED